MYSPELCEEHQTANLSEPFSLLSLCFLICKTEMVLSGALREVSLFLARGTVLASTDSEVTVQWFEKVPVSFSACGNCTQTPRKLHPQEGRL